MHDFRHIFVDRLIIPKFYNFIMSSTNSSVYLLTHQTTLSIWKALFEWNSTECQLRQVNPLVESTEGQLGKGTP